MVNYYFQYGNRIEDKQAFACDADAMIAARNTLRVMRRITPIPYVRVWAQCFNAKWREVVTYK